jgi:hypothetical protein
VIPEVTASGKIFTLAHLFDPDLSIAMQELGHLVSFFELNTKPALEVTVVSAPFALRLTLTMAF